MTDARQGAAEPRGLRVAVLADDLIWATRLGSIVRAAGAQAAVAGSAERFSEALAAADAAIVDLAARRADPFAAIEAAAGAGLPVVGVGPHEDVAARKRALAAGAQRVYAYSKLFEDGPPTIAAWLGLPAPVLADASAPAGAPVLAAPPDPTDPPGGTAARPATAPAESRR